MGFVGVLVLFVVGSIIWVGVDCHANRHETGRSPTGWVLACIVFWIVAFPAYLALRRKPIEPYTLDDGTEVNAVTTRRHRRQPVWNEETQKMEWR